MRNWSVQDLIVTLEPRFPEFDRRARKVAHRILLNGTNLNYSFPRSMPKSARVPETMIARRCSEEEIGDLLGVARTPGRGLIAILDLSLTNYAQLREIFLEALALYIRGECERHPGQTVFIIILPALPPAGLYWSALEGMESTDSTVITVDRRGKMHVIGTNILPEEVAWEYGTHEAAVRSSARELFARRIIGMMGHFPVGDQACTQYYWDASEGVAELAEAISAEIRGVLDGQPLPAPPWLVVPKDAATWLTEAAALAAEQSHCEVKTISSDTQATPRRPQPGWVFLLMDTITTGQRFGMLRDWGIGLEPRFVRSLVALKAQGYHANSGSELHSMSTYPPVRVPRTACPQCALGLPFSDRTFSSPLQIRSFDMWTLLQTVNWQREAYAPVTARRDAHFADLEEVAQKNSRYLAYCYVRMLRYIVPKDPRAIIFVDEPAISRVMDEVAELLRGNVQLIRIPRLVLDLIENADSEARLGDLDPGSEWDRQLTFASEQGTPIVIADEFIASGSTLSGLRALVHSYGASINAAIPLLNRSGRESMKGIPLYGLYDLNVSREGSR